MKRRIVDIISPILAGLLTFVLVALQPFSAWDNLLTDRAYSQLRGTSRDIMLLTIDEQTLNAYGSFGTWSRTKTAEAIERLYMDPENAPAAVGVDITFQGETNPEADAALAEACAGDRIVVTSGALVFRGQTEMDVDGNRKYNAYHIDMVEYPYDALRDNVTTGYANAFLGIDSVDRYYMTDVQYQGETLPSFAYSLASAYAQQKGIALERPQTDAGGLFRFFYAGKSGDFQHVSLKTFLEGSIPASEFKGKIVLIGAYASGMQDSYLGTADTEGNLYGVEIQANVMQAYLDGATAVEANRTVHAAVMAVIVLVLAALLVKVKLLFAVLVPVLVCIGHVFAGRYLSANGLLISQLYVILMTVVLVAYFIVRKYLAEAMKRAHVMKVFGRYMEPSLVARLSKEGSIESSLGGENRDVSVLFVDIRGFTSMSESLSPEEVVGILNDYLGLVTECIFKHHGMLDKFIGDAAMAVFNAPANQEDYYFESVAAAWDIAQGSKKLGEKLMEKFGRTVSYGIGVNCGPAVVGNIGCDFRMDYTAIGDTVNTAARLEANAARGEILISPALKEKLEGRIITEEAGAMQFKGKSEPMNVYRVTGIIG